MRSIQNWSIRRRLVLAFAGVLIPYLALVLVGMVGFRIVGERFQAIREEIETELAWAADLQVALTQLVMPPNDYLITGEVAERERFEQRLTRGREILARLETAHGAHVHPEELELLGGVRDRLARIETLGREILAVPDPLVNRAARVSMKALDQLGDESAEVLSRFRRIGMREIQEEIEGGKTTIRQVAAAGLLALGLSVAGGMGLALLFARWIAGPLEAIAVGSRRMAEGDLSARADEGAGAELGVTGRAFNAMAERLEASHAALRRTNEESETRRRQAEALAAVGRDLAQSLDIGVVGQRIADSVRGLLGVQTTALYRVEPESGDLRVVAVSGEESSAFGPGVVFPPGTGAVGLAVEERRPVVSGNVLADPRITFTPELRARIEVADFRAILAIPLFVKERVIGALGVRDREGRVFGAEDIRLAEAFADQAALALENARLYAETRAREAEVARLYEVAQELASTLETETVLDLIVEGAVALLPCDSSVLFIYDAERGGLVTRRGRNLPPELAADFLLRPGEGVAGLAYEQGSVVASSDIAADPRIRYTPATEIVVRAIAPRGMLAVPIASRGEVRGVLVGQFYTPHDFSPREVRLLSGLADQAAVALENARLFEEAQRAMSDLKAAQEQLIQGATMRALGELASGAAHHLNNLMAIVLGRVRLLLAGPAAASARRPLEIIERAAMDASEVVRRVSRFARMQPMEEWQPLDLRQLASEILELTRARWQDAAQAQGIRIEAGLEGPDVPPIMGNAAALREVLINLVLNAVEALPDGGKITVKAFVEDGWAGLAVSDTGVGMPPGLKERALEPFFTTKGPKSTGLGLSAAYGILQRHGGKLEIESDEGRGTTVTVRLPVASPVESARPRAEPAPGGAPALRILVIDDDDEVREVVAEMLGAEGHAVLQARGGRQGLGLLEAGEKVDLVLTDLGMPEMNGWDVARAIRARWPGLPVGMLTGWGEQIDESSEDCRMVAGVLSKPATPEGLREFVAACRSAMGGK